jgi:hypothetical protein
MGFEVLTAMVMNKPSKKSRQKAQSSSASYLLNVGFSLGLHFDPEYGGTRFIRNVG